MPIRAGARKGLDRAVYAGWQASCRAADVEAGSLLDWARTGDGGYCLASSGVLSVHPGGDRFDTGWQHIGWHRIERGGFDADASTLRWTLYPEDANDPEDINAALSPGGSSTTGAVQLPEPGRVPLIFRDRVAASIAVEQFVRLRDREPIKGREHTDPGVIVSGRRDLGRLGAPISWHASLAHGTSWETPGIRDLAAASIARLKAEYDPEI